MRVRGSLHLAINALLGQASNKNPTEGTQDDPFTLQGFGLGVLFGSKDPYTRPIPVFRDPTFRSILPMLSEGQPHRATAYMRCIPPKEVLA